MAAKREFHFSIDRGGTFTDVFAQVQSIPWVIGLCSSSLCNSFSSCMVS
jgi:hypothetical protein